MRRTLLPSTILVGTLTLLSVGCGASVSEYRFEEHAIRIDRTQGDAHAQVFVDECPVEGLYYDGEQRQWGLEGYTYGPSYWALDELAEDVASWDAARCEPTATRPDEATPAPTGAGFAAR